MNTTDEGESAPTRVSGLDTSAFLRWVHSLADAGDPRVRFATTFGEDDGALQDELRAGTRRMVRTLWRSAHASDLRTERDDTAYIRKRGLERKVVRNALAIRESPLCVAAVPDLHVGSVPHTMVVIDDRLVTYPGHDIAEVWTSTDRGVVSQAAATFEAVWATARPVTPAGSPPAFTPRMLDLAVLLVEGATDAEISRELGISQRTVSADIAELGRRLGAHGRAQTIAAIHGTPQRRPR